MLGRAASLEARIIQLDQDLSDERTRWYAESYPGLSDEVRASVAAVEKELLIETQRAADLKKARAERREIVDNALRNLQNVGKKAHLIHKK